MRVLIIKMQICEVTRGMFSSAIKGRMQARRSGHKLFYWSEFVGMLTDLITFTLHVFLTDTIFFLEKSNDHLIYLKIFSSSCKIGLKFKTHFKYDKSLNFFSLNHGLSM